MKLDSKKQIALGAIMSYISIGINIVTGLVFTPWMIHSIGKENYGLFTLALSVISLFVFDFGLSSAITRFLSIYIADGKKEKIEQCLGLVLRIFFYSIYIQRVNLGRDRKVQGYLYNGSFIFYFFSAIYSCKWNFNS